MSPVNRSTVLLAAGILLLVLGIGSLFVPIPMKKSHGLEAGEIRIGIEHTVRERVHPAVSAALIAGGVTLLVLGRRKPR